MKYKIWSKRSKKALIPVIRFYRMRVMWRKWRRSLDKNLSPKDKQITAFEEKGIRLWKNLLKNKETHLSYSILGIRQVERGDSLITFHPTGGLNEYMMTIMNVTETSKSLYEMHMPGKHADEVCRYFDNEMEKRMNRATNSKRYLIESDIDKLINQEEILKNKKVL